MNLSLNRFQHWNLDGSSDSTSGGSVGGDGSSTNTGNAVSGASNEPQPIDVDPDNTYIRIKGQDKPIKFGDYGRDFQARFTRATQESAQLKRQLQAIQAEKTNWEASQRGGQNQPGGSANQDVFGDLKKLPYLNGEQAHAMAQSIAEQIKTRDMVTLGMLKQFQALKSTVEQLNGAHVNNRFEGVISGAMKQHGIPDELKDWAKEVYLAYEGDDLDSEYPTIIQNRWEQMKKVLSAQQKVQLEQAKARKWVPGVGGNAVPSKPLQFKGDESASSVAESLWESLQGSDT
jgi:hypothetical protein